jgi:hypothetical protein
LSTFQSELHGSQFDEAKLVSPQADTDLQVEGGALRVQADREYGQGEQRGRDEQPPGSDGHVEGSLCPPLMLADSEALGEHEVAEHRVDHVHLAGQLLVELRSAIDPTPLELGGEQGVVRQGIVGLGDDDDARDLEQRDELLELPGVSEDRESRKEIYTSVIVRRQKSDELDAEPRKFPQVLRNGHAQLGRPDDEDPLGKAVGAPPDEGPPREHQREVGHCRVGERSPGAGQDRQDEVDDEGRHEGHSHREQQGLCGASRAPEGGARVGAAIAQGQQREPRRAGSGQSVQVPGVGGPRSPPPDYGGDEEAPQVDRDDCEGAMEGQLVQVGYHF